MGGGGSVYDLGYFKTLFHFRKRSENKDSQRTENLSALYNDPKKSLRSREPYFQQAIHHKAQSLRALTKRNTAGLMTTGSLSDEGACFLME